MDFLNIADYINTATNYILTFMVCFIVSYSKEFNFANKNPKKKLKPSAVFYYAICSTVLSTVLNKVLSTKIENFSIEYRAGVCTLLSLIAKPLFDAITNRSVVYSIIKGFARWFSKNGNDIVGYIKEEIDNEKRDNNKDSSE